MKTSYYISDAAQSGNLNLVFGKSKVDEDEFWKQVKSKIEAITLDRPEKRDETLKTVRDHLMKGKSSNITIQDKYFFRVTK